MAQITVEDLARLVLCDSKQEREEEKVETFDVTGKTCEELTTHLREHCISTRSNLVESNSVKGTSVFQAIVRELSNQLLQGLIGQKEPALVGTYSKRKSLVSFLSIQNAIAAQSCDESSLDTQLQENTKSKSKVLLHSQKALLLARRNAFDEARGQLESAASLYTELEQVESDVSPKDFASVWSLIGVFRAVDGSFEEASEAFEKSLLLDADNLDTLVKYSVFIFPFDESKANQIFQRAQEITPKSSDYHYHLAQYQCSLGNFISALENAEKAVELDASNSAAKFLVKQIVLETKNQEKLREILGEILAASDDTDLLGLKAQFLLSTGQTEASLRIADQISSLESDNPTSHIIRGHALCQAAQLDESIASFEAALRLEETSEALLSLAQLKSYKSQSLDEAASYLALIRKAILLSKSETERQTLAGIYVATEADIDAARTLGLTTVISTGK